MSKALLVVLATAFLAGCASSEVIWTKKGGITENDVRADTGQCDAQSGSVPAGSVPGMLPARSVMLYNACMRSRGWYQIDVPTMKNVIRL